MTDHYNSNAINNPDSETNSALFKPVCSFFIMRHFYNILKLFNMLFEKLKERLCLSKKVTEKKALLF